MFDIGFSEWIVIAVAILVAVGPRDIPDVMFRFGRLMRRVKIFLSGVRDQYADIMHDAEVEHYRKKYVNPDDRAD
jgi:Tat protein translocase TatB subunit